MNFTQIPKWFNFKRSFLLIGILWVTIHSFLFYRYGIVTQFEATKYIEQADFFLQTGHFTSKNFIFYSTEIFLIIISKSTNTFPWGVVLFQLLLNAISVALFYKLGLFFTKNHFRSFIITGLFISMIYYQIYNLYLFTESIYFSLGIIYTYFLFTRTKLTFKNICLIILGMSILYFTRPIGVFFIPSTFIYILLRFYRIKSLFTIPILILSALFYFLLSAVINSGGELNFLKPYIYEMVICGIPTVKDPNIVFLNINGNQLEKLWLILTNQTSLFGQLAIKRLIAFYGVVRSYYAQSHNIFIAIFFYTVYILTIINFRKQTKIFLPQTIYFICLIFFLTITVMLSCDEWHNRFILGILPFFILMAANVFLNDSRKTHS